jgi:hypothetical protein
MSVDNTKIAFSSRWEIDQLINSQVITVGSGDTAILVFAGDPPVFEVQFQPTGSSVWYSPGLNSTDGTLANTFTWYAYINGTQLHVNCSGGKIRYFVWGDKVDY